MTFKEYTEDRRSKESGIPVDDAAIAKFASRHPTKCMVCGCQVFDPFGMGIVTNDVSGCEGFIRDL